MEVHFTPEQEARLAQIASLEGVEPSRLVQDAALRLIEDDAHAAGKSTTRAISPGEREQKVCPECGYRFRGNGYDGIDSHWRAKHEDVMPYEEAWKLIESGEYTAERLDDREDLVIAETRVRDLREGRSRSHSLDDVERDLGLAR